VLITFFSVISQVRLVFEKFNKFKLIVLALTICLIPGIRNRQLLPFIRQQIIDFWNNKKPTTSSTPNVSISSSTPTISSVRTSAIIRPSSNQPTHTLYSTTSYGNNKTKAQ